MLYDVVWGLGWCRVLNSTRNISKTPEHIYFVVRPGSRPDDYDPIWLIQLIIIWPQRVDADASIDV